MKDSKASGVSPSFATGPIAIGPNSHVPSLDPALSNQKMGVVPVAAQPSGSTCRTALESRGPETAPKIRARKRSGVKITALTAYDFTTARLLDLAGVDLLLVGDSLSSTFQGLETTIPVEMDEMVYHAKCVARGARHALLVGDMPFLSYHISPEEALRNAGRLVKEGGMRAVKLEGGIAIRDTIAKITSAEIPVLGHVGLTPQSYLRMGGYRVQGRVRHRGDGEAAPGTWERVIEDAQAVEDAGAFGVVLECIPPSLAEKITDLLSIPTIGIGAGPSCDGQILVTADLLGLTTGQTPKFVKRYANLAQTIGESVGRYVEEVRGSIYPNGEFSYETKEENDDKSQKNAAM